MLHIVVQRIAYDPLIAAAPTFRAVVRCSVAAQRRFLRCFVVFYIVCNASAGRSCAGRGCICSFADVLKFADGPALAPVGAGGLGGPFPSSSMPPAAPFLSAAKEMGERTPPKTNGFWNSFRPITATPQKGPRRIAPAPIPASASTYRRKMPYPTAVEQCTSAWYVGAAAIRGLHAIRCTMMFGNLSRAWYAAAVFSAPQPRRKS